MDFFFFLKVKVPSLFSLCERVLSWFFLWGGEFFSDSGVRSKVTDVIRVQIVKPSEANFVTCDYGLRKINCIESVCVCVCVCEGGEGLEVRCTLSFLRLLKVVVFRQPLGVGHVDVVLQLGVLLQQRQGLSGRRAREQEGERVVGGGGASLTSPIHEPNGFHARLRVRAEWRDVRSC